MISFVKNTILALFFLTSLPLSAAQESIPKKQQPAEALSIFSKMAGKSWVTDNGKSGKERFHDISNWTWILDGRAIRITHSVNDGAYAGETLVYFDEKQQQIKMLYVTTGGFYTEGTATPDGDRVHYMETVHGTGASVTQVEAISQMTEDGHLVMKSRMKGKDGWGNWSTVTYRELTKD